MMDNIERVGMESSGFSDDKETGTMKEALLFRNRVNTSSQIALVGANPCPIQSLDYE